MQKMIRGLFSQAIAIWNDHHVVSQCDFQKDYDLFFVYLHDFDITCLLDRQASDDFTPLIEI